MSALAKCGECGGTGKVKKKSCEWCEGTGQVEVPDGFRKSKTRTKADRKRIAGDQEAAHEASVTADATVVSCPPARATIRMEN